MKAYLDTLEEHDRGGEKTYRVRDILHIEGEDRPDVAFLKVEARLVRHLLEAGNDGRTLLFTVPPSTGLTFTACSAGSTMCTLWIRMSSMGTPLDSSRSTNARHTSRALVAPSGSRRHASIASTAAA